ncbi:hypothetical protein ACEWY4_003524 [Coilia grayii]|uniref:Ig-like domain-containing protein n=1 Tax=Coilia grayii TaxID=363190 RepID=A0ABD1KSL8_9TELE
MCVCVCVCGSSSVTACCVGPVLGGESVSPNVSASVSPSVWEVRARQGDSVVLTCVAGNSSGSYTQWLQVCPDDVPHFLYKSPHFLSESPRFSFKRSKSGHGCYDLHIANVTHSDQCVYYYSLAEKDQHCDYTFQKTRTRLTLTDAAPVYPSCPPVSCPGNSCSLSHTLLLITCCLLSALLTLTCATGLCHKDRRVTGDDFKVVVSEHHQCEKTQRGLQCFHTEVMYTLISAEDS